MLTPYPGAVARFELLLSEGRDVQVVRVGEDSIEHAKGNMENVYRKQFEVRKERPDHPRAIMRP